MGHRGARVISALDIERILGQLKNLTIADKEIRKQYVEKIRFDVKERKAKEASLICPKCGGNLIKRHGKYGEFFGCSNYPKCRFTLKG